MKILIAVFCFLFGVSSYCQTSDIRKAYKNATESEKFAENFYTLVKDVTESSKPELMAYKGAGKTLLARYLPLGQRKEKVKEGVSWVEKAIKKDPKNLEVRLIRLSIQENLPKFFKYNTNIEEDKKYIKDQLPTLKDKELKEMVNGYFAKFSKK